MRQQALKGLAVALVAGAGLALAVGACSSTQMTNTWKSPTAAGVQLSKVAVVCMARDEAVRRIAEDDVANQLGPRATASYTILADTDLKDRPAVKAKLARADVDGVLIMRLTGVTEQVTPGMGPYGSYNGYYDYAYGSAYGAQVSTRVHVVSSLYSLRDGTLIWAGTSQTFDPASVKEVLDGVSKAVAKEVQKNRLIL
jgi:hypothetical protein